MNNKQASDRLMKTYQAEGEKILTKTDDSELMSALDCAFGAFETIETLIAECKNFLENTSKLTCGYTGEEAMYLNGKINVYENILYALEAKEDKGK